jgi:hypothetical protein
MLSGWKQQLPKYLDWDHNNSALSKHPYLKLQRAYLEVQFRCLEMKLNWSIGHLDPILMPKSICDTGDSRGDSFRAGQRVLEIVDGMDIKTSRLCHWDALRTTINLVKTLLKNDFVESQIRLKDLVAVCRDGVRICRKLIPDSLTDPEMSIEDTIGK